MTTRNLRNHPPSTTTSSSSNTTAPPPTATSAPSAARRPFNRRVAPPATTYQDVLADPQSTAMGSPRFPVMPAPQPPNLAPLPFSLFYNTSIYGPDPALGYLRTDGAASSAATGSGRMQSTRVPRMQAPVNISRRSEELHHVDLGTSHRPIAQPQFHTSTSAAVSASADDHVHHEINSDDEILIPSSSTQQDLEALVTGLERERARSAQDEELGGGDADDEDGGRSEDEDEGFVVDPRMIEAWRGVGGRGKVDLGEFRAALHTSLLHSVAGLDRDKWMFEREEESEGSN